MWDHFYRCPRHELAIVNPAVVAWIPQRHIARLPLAVLLLLISHTSIALAQRAQKANHPDNNALSFSDPQKFIQQFFGSDVSEGREEIEKISVSPREEQKLGSRGVEALLADLRRQKIKFVSRGKDVDYLQKLTDELRPQMQNHARYRLIRVYIAESDRLDARSFPGGNLVFFRGMLDFVENEAALIGVAGHELSHLDRGHQLYDVKRMKFMQSTFSGVNGFSPDYFLRNGTLLMHSFTRPFRPEEEAEADRDGVRWVYEAGYDPREMANLFLRLHKRGLDKPGGGRATPSFFRTHPYHIDRYHAVLDQLKRLQTDNPKKKLFIGHENLKRRVPRSMREFAE